MRRAAPIAGVTALVAVASAIVILSVRQPRPYILGAYYYGWYTSGHWQEFGYLGPHLPEPLEPSFGEYNSEDPEIVRQHVQWAYIYGIDFLLLDWSLPGNAADRQARNLLMPALAGSSVRQAPVMELLAYGDTDLAHDEFRRRLTADVRYVGEHYLRHPSVMRVDGRPLLFLYLTRRLRGDIAGWIAEVRRDLLTIGVDPFIVADEVFWEDVDPDPARLRAFDAITAYNVYDWPLTRHRGWADESTFFADVEGLFGRWRDAASAAGIPFVPNIMPGYNDRGVRLKENHYVIPRQTHPDGPITGFLERSIDLAKRYTDRRLRMVTLTSFNEWHEWTQVEPTRRATPHPPEATSNAHTQGYPHPAYEFEYLDVIRERLEDRP